MSSVRLIPNDLQEVARAFLRDRASDGYSHSIRGASWDGDVYSIAAALDAGELVDDFGRYVRVAPRAASNQSCRRVSHLVSEIQGIGLCWWPYDKAMKTAM